MLLESQFLRISRVDKDLLGKMSCHLKIWGVISFVSIKDHRPGWVIRTFEKQLLELQMVQSLEKSLIE
jgi:hypothetical protein